MEEAFPILLLQFSSFLKAGYAIPQAFHHLSQSSEGKIFLRILKEKDQSVPNTPFSILIQFLHSSIHLSTKNGVPLSPILKRISELSQTHLHLQHKMRVLTFPLRAQGGIAILLPWFVLLIFGFMDPSLILSSLTQPIGIVGFSTALVMDGLAIFWIQRLLR